MEQFYGKPKIFTTRPRMDLILPPYDPSQSHVWKTSKTKKKSGNDFGLTGIGFKIFERVHKKHCEPESRVVVRGWRCWRLIQNPYGISIEAPIRSGPAVLMAEECTYPHCDPSCKPPCHECECGVYLRYEPPSLDESNNSLTVSKGRISSDPHEKSFEIWFFCEALGKVIYGDIGARAERIRPLWGFAPQTNDGNFDDTWRRLKLYLPAYFGPHLQLFRLDDESMKNLKWGEVWEE